MSQITKSASQAIDSQSEEKPLINEGDLWIEKKYDDGYPLIRIDKIETRKSSHSDEIYLVYYYTPLNYDGTEYYKNKQEKSYNESSLLQSWNKLTVPIEELSLQVDQMDAGTFKAPEIKNTETALMGKTSKAALEVLAKDLNEKISHWNNANILLKAKHYLLEKALKDKREQMIAYRNVMMKQLDKANKTIQIIELYLGISEEIIQLHDGALPDPKELLHLRQLVLFMNEEASLLHYEDQGLDFRDVDKFDAWLLKDENWRKIIPEQRSIVAFRPRRSDKEYGDSWSNTFNNIKNKYSTYLLCRNGENVYRIYTNKIQAFDVLFPKNDELQQENDKINSGRSSSWDKDKFDQKVHEFRTIIGLLQGLIDRADLFGLQGQINLTQPEEGQPLRLIYDAEHVLSDGHISFRDWKKNHSESIVEGCRILNGAFYSKYEKEKDRLFYWVSSEWKVPPVPESGIYQVYKRDKNLYISYLPKDEVCGIDKDGDWYSRERKKSVSWKIYPYDDFLINYDQLDLETVEYFLQSRADRPNYIKMIPALLLAKQELLKEAENEKGFKEGIILQLQREGLGDQTKLVDDLISWWKLKNKWKRYLHKDDEKAWRMILREAKRRLK